MIKGKENLFTACHGFQLTSLKDKMERIVFLFNDGTLKAMDSYNDVQSRIQLEIKDSTVLFKNVHGYYLNAGTMSWINKVPGPEEIFSMEADDDFISIKSSDNKYLTVSSDGILKFESDVVNDNTMFYIDRHCSKGNA